LPHGEQHDNQAKTQPTQNARAVSFLSGYLIGSRHSVVVLRQREFSGEFMAAA
jgi:hypothetical protein